MPQFDQPQVQTSFPDYPVDTLPAEVAGWKDTSWHNDVCPSFKKGDLLVWVDWPDPREREDFDGRRFILCRLDDEGCLPVDGATLIETDDWAEVLALLD